MNAKRKKTRTKKSRGRAAGGLPAMPFDDALRRILNAPAARTGAKRQERA